MTSVEKELRELLWLRHGCDFKYLYGDDGEMQCSKCQIDFKRMPPIMIKNQFVAIGLAKLEKMDRPLDANSWLEDGF